MPEWVGHDLDHGLLAHGGDGFHVARDHRLKGLLIFPLRMLVRLRLHLVDGEDQLSVHRHLDPERAIIVESGDTLFRIDVVGTALLRHLANEI
jgi:hypothetical protein